MKYSRLQIVKRLKVLFPVMVLACFLVVYGNNCGSSPAGSSSVSAGGGTATAVAPGACDSGSVFGSGTGTSTDPYYICTRDHWNAIGAHSIYLDRFFVLGANIDFAGGSFVPIGDGSVPFTGQFDGGSFSLSNITIDLTNGGNEAKTGVFRYVGAGAYIHDLFINNMSLTKAASLADTGTLIGRAEGSAWTSNLTKVRIARVTVAGTLSFSIGVLGRNVGGLIGYMQYTQLSNATVNSPGTYLGAVNNSSVGGLIGASDYTNETSDSTTNLNVTASSNTGGFMGIFQSSGGCLLHTISNSKATGNVASNSNYVGGFVGRGFFNCAPGTIISNSKATGNVTTTSPSSFNIGGFCGDTCSATDSYATGNLITFAGSNKKGGFCGNGCTITTSYSTGSINNAEPTTGGLCGSSCTVTNSYWDTDTSGLATSPGGGTGASTASMQISATFTGWNTSTSWSLSTGYPKLLWEL